MKIQAIVFDMDGLMVDSEPLARRAWDRVLARYGHALDDALTARMVGHRTGESAAMVRDHFDLPLPAAELAAEKQRVWEGLWRQGLPTMPGLEALHAAIAARGLPWAVATSSPRHYALHVLDDLGLAERCRAVVGGDEVEHGKPAPDIYLRAAERLGVAPAACLALEDSVPGGQAAHTAGMRLVAVPNGTTGPADFDFAPYVFDSLHEVAANLDALLA